MDQVRLNQFIHDKRVYQLEMDAEKETATDNGH